MKNKIFALAMIFCSFAFAQDFDDWGSFSDDTDGFGGGSSPSITISGEGEHHNKKYHHKTK